MKRFEKSSIIISLIRRLESQGSWCGETHIQKAIFFLQEISGFQVKFNYLLYYYGPFSFELREKLNEMRAEESLQLIPNPPPYGPSYVIGPLGKRFENIFRELSKPYEKIIDFIAKEVIDQKNVHELESLSTALYFINKYTDLTIEEIAEKIHKLKPHISQNEAIESIKKVKEIKTKAKSIN